MKSLTQTLKPALEPALTRTQKPILEPTLICTMKPAQESKPTWTLKPNLKPAPMRPLKPLLAVVLLASPWAVRADNLALPAGAPPAFATECGACHLAFPPALLDAQAWHQVMARLDDHYGDNASLDNPTRQSIERFLVRHAGGAKVSGAQALPGEPPRLTLTPWFKRKHHEVPARDWRDPKVKSAANCEACHQRAAAGSYREREIVMPNGRPWKEHDDD